MALGDGLRKGLIPSPRPNLGPSLCFWNPWGLGFWQRAEKKGDWEIPRGCGMVLLRMGALGKKASCFFMVHLPSPLDSASVSSIPNAVFLPESQSHTPCCFGLPVHKSSVPSAGGNAKLPPNFSCLQVEPPSCTSSSSV